MSGNDDAGRPHRSGSHRMELLNAKPETPIVVVRARVPAAAGSRSASRLSYATERVVPSSSKSLENQPTTSEALHSGPSTVTFFSPADTVATGHAPNALRLWNVRQKPPRRRWNELNSFPLSYERRYSSMLIRRGTTIGKVNAKCKPDVSGLRVF